MLAGSGRVRVGIHFKSANATVACVDFPVFGTYQLPGNSECPGNYDIGDRLL